MSDQKVSNERRKELEQMDPFQENLIKAIAFAKAYKKQLGLVIGALVLIVAVVSAILYSFERAENTASALLSQALQSYADANDSQKGYERVKDDFEVLFKDYTNTAAGRQARLEYAKICFDVSKFDQSEAYYKEALGLFSHEALMENFILVSLGHVSLAKKDEAAAVQYFEQVKNSKTPLLKDEALFALGLIAEASGRPAESRAAFEKIVSDFETSLYYPVAKSKIN
jgi:hypothetical protein